MEHLPLPLNSGPHLRIPCIATQEYDGGLFLSFPQRHGWTLPRFESLEYVVEAGLSQDGAVPSIPETQAFLQTWLYFGTIHHVFDGFASSSSFVSTDLSGNKFLCTSKLQSILNKWLEHYMADVAAQNVQRMMLQEWCERSYEHISSLYDSICSTMGYNDSSSVLATALLGESLANLVSLIYRNVLHLETPVPMPWGSTFSYRLGSRFKDSNWCPSLVSRISQPDYNLMVTYYHLHLPHPQDTFDHAYCSESSCVALKIDPATYRTTHIVEPCDCPELTLDCGLIGMTLNDHKLPLIEVDPRKKPQDVRVLVREDDQSIPFVAISHVWADGLGNVDSNSLPACSLQDVSRLVQQLPKGSSQLDGLVPFWIDTICVPVRPKELKNLALERLRDPYTRAKHVLVLDKFLRSLSNSGRSILEMVSLIRCSAWCSRLWCLQEGQLAQNVWFQFKDRAINLEALWEDYKISTASKGFDPYVRSMTANAIAAWTVTKKFGREALQSQGEVGHNLVETLRSKLWPRSVSVLSDEALCLFCLANFDMSIITAVPPSVTLRMQVFWSQVKILPSGLVFSKYPTKLDIPGLRWAPTSFLGPLPRRHWAGTTKVEQDCTAVPTPRGLRAHLPGYLFTIDYNNLPEPNGFFLSQGTWYRVYFEEPWHQCPAIGPSGRAKMAYILMEPLLDSASRDFEQPQKFHVHDSHQGILASVIADEAGVKYVKALCHGFIMVQPPLDQFVNDAVLECVSTLWADGEGSLPEERAAKLTWIWFERHPAIASACEKWIVGTSFSTAERRFAARMIEMTKPTNHNIGTVERLNDDQEWCVD